MRMNPGEAAREQEYVVLALRQATVFAAGVDQAIAAMNVRPVSYSALRTQLEQAEKRATAVLAHLRGELPVRDEFQP